MTAVARVIVTPSLDDREGIVVSGDLTGPLRSPSGAPQARPAAQGARAWRP
jgi:hypothetical protein